VGFGISSGLLIYNGKELVNALIYFAIIVVLPFFFSLLSIIGLIFRKNLELLELSYLFGVFFSVGALVSLLFMVTTQDIAFGWATTLNIKPQSLSSFLNTIALWKGICNSCVVDEHLSLISQFVRLGGKIEASKITYAKELGAWWKFLAFAIVTYGIIFRSLLFIIVKILKPKTIKIVSQKNQEKLDEASLQYNNKIDAKELKSREFRVFKYYCDCNLKSSSNAKDIVVCVKSWEPPILDFFDYLEELQARNKDAKISIFLTGLNDKVKQKDIEIWQRKLNELNLNYEVIV